MQRSDDLSYRHVSFRAPGDEESRTIEITAATETPVKMPDFERGMMIDEILLMEGARMPEQVTFLDSHSRSSVEDVLGSVREFSKENGQLGARATFRNTQKASDALQAVRDGHITDLSAGYSIRSSRHVPEGKTKTIGNREFTGPVNVVTQWELREVSLTPIGADSNAKVRSDQGNPFEEEMDKMNDFARKLLVARGMPAELDDDQALKWLVDRGLPEDSTTEELEKWIIDNIDKTENRQTLVEPARVDEGHAERAATKALEAFKAEQEAERKRVEAIHDEIRVDAEIFEVPDLADEAVRKFDSSLEARKWLRDEHRKRVVNNPIRISFVGDQRDKHFGALRTAFLHRSLQSAGVVSRRYIDEEALPNDQRSDGWEDFRYASMLDLARECLQMSGISLRGWSTPEIAQAALGFFPDGRRGQRADYGWHTTGSFAQLTLDAVNKSLQSAYAEKPMTWRQVFRTAASVPDFKNIHRIRLSESPDLNAIPDNAVPDSVAFGDEKETYAVQTYARLASFSWQLLVNDDMDALSRIPALMGRAAERTINKHMWSIVTGNPTMTDGQSLFSDATGNRKDDNLGTAAAISTTTLTEARKLMRLVRGVNQPDGSASDARLNITGRYLVVPAAAEVTALKEIVSDFETTANTFQVFNPFRNSMTVVVEPTLDDNSTTAWYVFADPSEVDTLELSFLQGQESPVTTSDEDFKTKALLYRIEQTFAGKAIDWRGCFKNAGA